MLQSYIYVAAGEGRAAARAAEIEIAAGAYRGPMHGITIAYKDIIDVRGMETTAASKLMAENIAEEDATVTAKFRGAGAVCLGKLNLIEFASGSMGVYGFTRNAWNLAANPGSSSSGSGVAVAGGARDDGPRHRHRWLGAKPVLLRRSGRPAAYLRSRQPRRMHPAELEPGQHRPDGAQRL